jgi:ferric-chelate reductase (NADPH)
MDVDSQAGSARFLFYRHEQGPGSAWAASLREGDLCKLMRPKNSIDFTKEQGSAVLFGDETSFAAAQVLQQSQQDPASARCILEVGSLPDARLVVSTLGLEHVTLLHRTEDGSHLEQATQELRRLASILVSPTWFFTGCAPSIQVVRTSLKADGVSLNPGAVKPYWSPGKKGID